MARQNKKMKPKRQYHMPVEVRPRCGLCGKKTKLTRTECCGQWICNDEDNYELFSYARNSCHRNHRRYTLCGHHFAEGHVGHWKDCPDCRVALKTEMYVWYGTNGYNFEKLRNPPDFEPTHCSRCNRVIRLGEEGHSRTGDECLCESCTTKEFGHLFT